MRNSVTYKDLNLLFRVGPGDLVLQDEDVINQSVANILGTQKRSRVFNRNFGSNIHNSLFESITPAMIRQLKTDIYQALSIWEPRISLSTQDVVVNGFEDEQLIEITVNYIILATSQTGTFNDIINLK